MMEAKEPPTYTVLAKVKMTTEQALKAEQGRMQQEKRATVRMPEVVASILNNWADNQSVPG
ncbi:hypothetical protein [Hymenobacter tenuis]